MREKNRPVEEFEDPKWVCDLAFLVDITHHLNPLNTSLQGRDVLIPDLLAKVKAFRCKLRVWEQQLRRKDTTHFVRVTEHKPSAASCRCYADAVGALFSEFSSRFQDVWACEEEFRLFSAPFDVDSGKVAAHLQMEVIELQCDDGSGWLPPWSSGAL